MSEKYDVIIIGAGPAGLTAAMYTSRRNLKTLVLSKNLGGQVILTPLIENYPGFREISGVELTEKFEAQAKEFGAEIILEEVIGLSGKDGDFTVKTDSNEYKAKALILTSGKTPRSLDVPGEKELTGKGVTYCAICDAPLFKDRIVAVIGGGNSALDATLMLSDIAKKVYLIHRRLEFRGFEAMVEKIKGKKNVELVLDSVVTEFKGDDVLKSTTVENVKTKETKELEIDGAFIEVGFQTKTDIMKGVVDLDENNQVVINVKCETSASGIFAAGDITNVPFKQIVVAGGEGAKAGLQVYNHINNVTLSADWAHKNK